nr:C25 family cysteine peptidase [Dyadobacter sp. NIV53]
MVKHLFASFFLLLSLFPTTLIAQWGYPYSNSWIDFSKPYVKIGITTSGLQKISFSSLPYDFPVNQPEKIQLFHLGKEVSILSTDNNEILFYAVPNDGATDSLLYRPMSSRLNPYSSIYSNRTAYFLTIGNLAGKRAVRVLTDKNSNLEPTKVHIQKYLQSNTQEYSHSTAIYIKPEFINSFFEHGASRTGVRLLGNKIIPFTIKLDSLQKNQTTQPSIKLLLHGRSNNSRAIEVYVGKDSLNLRKAGSVNIVDFIAQIFEFKIESTDIGANGALTFALKSTSTLPEERFSVGFYLVTYPQALILNSLESKIFNLPPINGSSSRIQISDYQNTYKSYDITDANNPTILDGSLSDFTMPRQTGKQTIIFSSKKINIVESSQILKTTFYKINPADFNYVIITNETLKDAANRYADYRSSAEGGSYSPIVIKIKDIYDQFNYGEVSPVAIRRFIDYTMSDSNKDKYLLLFGKSITFVERMLPELSEDVPSVGYPGSDLLLVDGLAGFPVNVPAMPVGRISAVTEVQADNYLEKVKEYEGNVSGSFEWKREFCI